MAAWAVAVEIPAMPAMSFWRQASRKAGHYVTTPNELKLMIHLGMQYSESTLQL